MLLNWRLKNITRTISTILKISQLLTRAMMQDMRPLIPRMTNSMMQDLRPLTPRMINSMMQVMMSLTHRMINSMTQDMRPATLRMINSMMQDLRPFTTRMIHSMMQDMRPLKPMMINTMTVLNSLLLTLNMTTPCLKTAMSSIQMMASQFTKRLLRLITMLALIKPQLLITSSQLSHMTNLSTMLSQLSTTSRVLSLRRSSIKAKNTSRPSMTLPFSTNNHHSSK